MKKNKLLGLANSAYTSSEKSKLSENEKKMPLDKCDKKEEYDVSYHH